MRPRRSPWLFILFFILPALAAAQPKARLIGKIVDQQGKAIAGVTVTATSPQIPTFKETLTTDRRGTFLIDFDTVNVTYHYRFDKPGYETLEVDQNWQLEGTQHFEWKMSPGKPTVSGAAPVTTSEPAVAAFNAGVAAINAKDYATAETRFKEAVTADPKLARGWAALSSVAVQNAHYQDAADAAETAMALGLKDEAVLTSRWQAYRNLKDEAKTAAALKDLESVGRATEEAKKIHNEGVALVKAGDNAGALAKFQEALKVDPSLQQTALALANVALKMGRNADAATAAETVLKGDPKNAEALRLRYNACLQLPDKSRLFDALVGLAAVEPAVASKGMLALAFEAYDANDAPLAKQRFVKVLEVDPNQPLAHYYVGMVYVNEGATREARTHLERFVELAPNSSEAATAREILKQLPKP